MKFIGMEVSAGVPPLPYIPAAGYGGIGHRYLNCAGVHDHRRRDRRIELACADECSTRGLGGAVPVHHRLRSKVAAIIDMVNAGSPAVALSD